MSGDGTFRTNMRQRSAAAPTLQGISDALTAARSPVAGSGGARVEIVTAAITSPAVHTVVALSRAAETWAAVTGVGPADAYGWVEEVSDGTARILLSGATVMPTALGSGDAWNGSAWIAAGTGGYDARLGLRHVYHTAPGGVVCYFDGLRGASAAAPSETATIPAADFAALDAAYPGTYTSRVRLMVQRSDGPDASTRWRLARSGILRAAQATAVILKNLGSDQYRIGALGPYGNSLGGTTTALTVDDVGRPIPAGQGTHRPPLQLSTAGARAAIQPYHPQIIDRGLLITGGAALPIGTPVAVSGADGAVGAVASASSTDQFIGCVAAPVEYTATPPRIAVATAGALEIPDILLLLSAGEAQPSEAQPLWLSATAGQLLSSPPDPATAPTIEVGIWAPSGDPTSDGGTLYIQRRDTRIDASAVISGEFPTARYADESVTDAKIAGVAWSKISGKPTSFPAADHNLTSSKHPDVEATDLAANQALIYDGTSKWQNKPVITVEDDYWAIKDAPVGYFGVSAIFAGGTPTALAAAAANQGQAWMYSATRYAGWVWDGAGKLVLRDGTLGVSDGADQIEYTPSATAANRSIKVGSPVHTDKPLIFNGGTPASPLAPDAQVGMYYYVSGTRYVGLQASDGVLALQDGSGDILGGPRGTALQYFPSATPSSRKFRYLVSCQFSLGAYIYNTVSSTPAAAQGGYRFLYGASYAGFDWEQGKMILADGELMADGPQGIRSLEYTPHPTDSSARKLNINVKLDLQGTAPTEGQAIVADANGKPEWGTVSGLPDGTATHNYLKWNGSAWVQVGTVNIKVCVGGVTRTYRVPGEDIT